MKRVEDENWNDNYMEIGDIEIANLTLDDAVSILVQLKAFDIALYKEIINANPETDNIKLTLKADLGMVILNNRISNGILGAITDLIEQSTYYQSYVLMNIQAEMYEEVIDRMYHEAKEQFNEE